MLKLSDYLTSDEIKALCRTSDAQGWYRVSTNYALLSLAFLLFAWMPNIITMLVSSWIIGGRILGIAVLNHDAGHGTLYKSEKLNHFIGHWLLGGLVLIDFEGYRNGHIKHHQLAGTQQDPDKLFFHNYPATTNSMLRKIFRDISGVNGVKELVYQAKVSTWRKRIPNLIVHGLILTILTLFQVPWAYAIFWTGYLFTYPLLARIRIMGEHASVDDPLDIDPRLNTRTTYANFLEKLLIAPNQVNFHLEHHIHQKIPAHNLKKAHVLFTQRGMYQNYNCVYPNYWSVLKQCINNAKGQSGNKHHAPSSVNDLS